MCVCGVCVCGVCAYVVPSHLLHCHCFPRLHIKSLIDLARRPLPQQTTSDPSELRLLQCRQSHRVCCTCTSLAWTADNTVVLQFAVTFLWQHTLQTPVGHKIHGIVHAHTHTRTHTHAHIRTHTHTHTHTHTRTHTHCEVGVAHAHLVTLGSRSSNAVQSADTIWGITADI